MTDPSRRSSAMSARARAAFTRRRLGRAITVAAAVAAVTCVVGAVVAWRLLGDLRDRSTASLQLVESTLSNVDESLIVAHDVSLTVGESLDTLRQSLGTLSTGVGDGAAAIDAVATLTEDIPPALDRLDQTLADTRDAAAAIDTALEVLDDLPIGPDLDVNARLGPSIDGVRGDLRPIAEDLRSSTTSLRDLAGASDELVLQLAALDGDLAQLDVSLDRSAELLETYRADTADARALARSSLDDLDRDITLARLLTIILALSIALGQLAPFHIGRELVRSESAQPPG